MKENKQAEKYLNHILSDRLDYEHHHQIYLKRRVFRTFQRLIKLFANTEMDGPILDVGGGRGEFTEVCNENGFDAKTIGIENGINFEHDPLPFDNNSFNLVCANSVIEHIHDPSLWLDEIHRILKPSGFIIIVTPHWPYAAKEFYNSYTHVQPYTYKSLTMALKCHHYKIRAMVPWLIEKPNFYWKIPPPWNYRLAASLPFSGLNKSIFIPRFLKGKSRTLLSLSQKTVQ